MDFDKIVLTLHEKQILKLSSKKAISSKQCERLLRLQLVYEITEQASPGSMPRKTGMCQITNLGTDYLLYRKEINRTQFVIPIIVTILTNIALQILKYGIPLLLQWIL